MRSRGDEDAVPLGAAAGKAGASPVAVWPVRFLHWQPCPRSWTSAAQPSRHCGARPNNAGWPCPDVIAESVREHLDATGPRGLAISGVGASDGTRAAREIEVPVAEDGPQRLGFIGMGHSGDGELSTRCEEYRRAAVANKTSQDV